MTSVRIPKFTFFNENVHVHQSISMLCQNSLHWSELENLIYRYCNSTCLPNDFTGRAEKSKERQMRQRRKGCESLNLIAAYSCFLEINLLCMFDRYHETYISLQKRGRGGLSRDFGTLHQSSLWSQIKARTQHVFDVVRQKFSSNRFSQCVFRFCCF